MALSLAARHALLQQQSRKQLSELTKPVAGNKGYICDLALVQLSEMCDPLGRGTKLNVRLWDNTCAAVQGTCWDAAKCAQLVAQAATGGGAVYAEVSAVRVGCNKMRDSELEVHINDNSVVTFVSDADPRVVALRLAAAPTVAAIVSVGTGTAVSNSHLLVPAVPAATATVARQPPVTNCSSVFASWSRSYMRSMRSATKSGNAAPVRL